MPEISLSNFLFHVRISFAHLTLTSIESGNFGTPWLETQHEIFKGCSFVSF